MNNKGIALVVTLLVLTLLLTIILEFGMDMRVEARSAANFRDEMQAYYLAKSGITFAIVVLEEDSVEDTKKDKQHQHGVVHYYFVIHHAYLRRPSHGSWASR